MTWPHMAGDDERLQHSGAAELKPLTHNNLAQLNICFGGETDIHGTKQARCKSSRCASCHDHLFRGLKCVFCKRLLFEGQHYCGHLWDAGFALNEQFPEDRPQCIKVEGSQEQPRSHVRAAQDFEISQLECESHCAAHEGPYQAGQESHNSAHNPIPTEFCTQKCMLGLVHHLKLDDACPNVTTHRQGLETDSHQINCLQLSSLLTSQLALDPKNGCTPLKLGSLPGRLDNIDKHVIFRITLTSHGYTLIGKATQMITVRKLRREREAYLILRKMQGKKVPVLLGDIFLAKPWSLSPEDVRPQSGSAMVYMLLLSHAGRPLNPFEVEACHSRSITRFEEGVRESQRKDGSFYQDVREFRKIDIRGTRLRLEPDKIRTRNILWNDELGRVMFIDFERVDLSKKWTAVIDENEGEYIA